MRVGRLAVLAAALAGCATVPAPPGLELAITVDDLPVHGPVPSGESPRSVAAAIIAALEAGSGATATGFVNGVWTGRDPASAAVLADWRAAGLPLANHGWAHRHLSEMSAAEFDSEVDRNAELLARLSPGGDWRWFRYPFLDEGESVEKRAEARAVLARRGYRIAAVTLDFSDWAWTEPYARCVASADSAAIARLEQTYLQAAAESVAFSRALSARLHGRDIRYVLLLHSSAMTARMMPRLLDLYRKAGFGFVSLARAQADPYYRADMDPSLPALPHTLEGRAQAAGIALPERTDFQPELAAACR